MPATRALVLCADDAHLLDDASAALLHGLVAAGDATAILTIRAGEPAPDAIGALWKDELCERVPLGELSRDEVERLVGEVLGGALDGRGIAALWELTRGNALFVREVVLHGLSSGGLEREGEVWHWRDGPSGGMRLSDIVGTRLDALGDEERGALELLAVGAPLEARLLVAEAGERAVAGLETAGIAVRREAARRRELDLVHPLHGEVVRSRLGATRLEALHRTLADALAATGARRREDLLRLAAWRLEAGETGSPDLFVRAANDAQAALDRPLAERLARAAIEGGGGFGAELALGRALASRGAGEEAEDVLGPLAERAGSDGERFDVALARARNLHWGLSRHEDAATVLLDAEAAIGSAALRNELAAVRAWMLCTSGDVRRGLEIAGTLLDDEQATERVRVRAAVTATFAHAARGRCDLAIAISEQWAPVAARHVDAAPHVLAQLLSARSVALHVGGRLDEALARAREVYELEMGAPQGAAIASFELGGIELTCGRARSALRHFQEATALLRGADTVGFLPGSLAGTAVAAAHLGDAALAGAALEELQGLPARANALFDSEIVLGEAWAAAVAGDMRTARDAASRAADLADARGADAWTMRALSDLARLGAPEVAAPRLAALAGPVEGPLAAAVALHAAALADGDAKRLVEVAELFAATGALLLAAEACDAAAAAFRRAGREPSARAAGARAAALLARCEDARPPTLGPDPATDELTAREREVATLAAAGLTSREIAGRLVVSVRTVDNHLQRAYRKLGVTRREELADLLAAAPE